MQVDFREITQNPINPRKISREGIERLKLSLLVFPKMLNVRPLIINDKKVILCGNMRHKALMEIFAMNIEEMKQFVLRNTKAEYENIEQSIEYWDKWKANPILNVEVSSLSEREEKELIIKDNISFGDFDTSKLDNYSKDELIDVGILQEEDETLLPPTRIGAEQKSIDKLKIGKLEVPMSMEEYLDLKEVFDKHVEEQGTSFGFVTTIKNNYEAN